MLVGWIDSYSDQILQIFLYTILIVLFILIVYSRRLYGIALPLLGMILTSIWGVGFMGFFGYNLDPLMLVVPFLISARSLSHGIQKVERYYHELQRTRDKISAARNTFNSLFRPGALAIVADAAALFLIGLGSVPINDKMGIYASFWAVSMLVTVPGVLLLLDFWPLRRLQSSTVWRLVWEKVPFLALSVASSVVTFLIQQGAGALSSLDALSLEFRPIARTR